MTPDVLPQVCHWLVAQGRCASPDVGTAISDYLLLSYETLADTGIPVCLAAVMLHNDRDRALAQTGQLELGMGIVKRPCIGYLAPKG